MCKYCEQFNGDANNYLDRQKIDLLEGRGINQEMFLMEDQNQISATAIQKDFAPEYNDFINAAKQTKYQNYFENT